MIRRPNTDPVGDPERLKLVVDIWKHSVDVQMHFNDMGMRIRNLYFTFLAAAIALIGVVQGKHIHIVYPALNVHLVLFVIVSIIPISMLFYFLDKHWYHRLLLGAVKHCAFIEEKYSHALPELQLGAAISKESPVKFDARAWRWWLWFIKDKRFRDPTTSNLHSDAKIEVLYKSVMIGAALLALAYAFLGGVEFDGCTLFAMIIHGQCPARPSVWGFPLQI